MRTRRKKQIAAGMFLLSSAGMVAGTAQVPANAAANDALLGGTQTEGKLHPINNSARTASPR